MKLALVTGVASGFGRAIVLDLLTEGWTVIATCRRLVERSETFSEATSQHEDRLRLLDCDVTDAHQREAIVSLIETEFQGKLDLLVSNAGYGTFGAFEDVNEAQLRAQFETNFFGPVLLMRRLLPALRATQGRVITVTSMMARFSMPLGSVYSASKYALEGLSEGLYYELKAFGVQLCTIQPGGHRTNFMRSAHWGERSEHAGSPYHQMTLRFQRMRDRMLSREKAPTAEKVSQLVIKLSKSRRMPRAVLVGGDARMMGAAQDLLPGNLYPKLMTMFFSKILKD